jgi:hypothetical protein
MEEQTTSGQPGLFWIIYMVVIFGAPFVICASYVLRQLLYLSRKGLFPRRSPRSAEVLELCQKDPHVIYLRRRGFRWMYITWIAWAVGFGVMFAISLLKFLLTGRYLWGVIGA